MIKLDGVTAFVAVAEAGSISEAARRLGLAKSVVSERVAEIERVLGAPALLMGFGLPGENAHAPDEWMSLDNYEKGTHAAAALLTEFAEG